MADSKPAKVYSYGSITNRSDIANSFKTFGAKNPMEYKFGDPSSLYFIDRNNQVAIAHPDSDLFYVITTSNDWQKLELKKPKRIRKFLITIKEGSPSCNGCEFSKKCNDEYRNKCELGKQLQKLLNTPELAGKTLQLDDLTDFNPITPPEVN